MPHIFVTRLPGGVFGNTGKYFYARPGYSAASDIVEVTLPTGVNRVTLRSTGVTFNGEGRSRMYHCGGFTDNLVFTENFALLRQGIPAPPNEIISGAGAGDRIGVTTAAGPGRTGNAIFYVAYWDDIHARRSPLSGPSPTIAMANQSASITNLPTTAPPSVTHFEEWCSMDGNLPRLVTRRQLGATTILENTATLALGEAFVDDFEAFPRCRWNVMWHDRQVMAGDDRYPDRLYLSLLNEPERYGRFFIRTRKGERIVGLVVVRDNLIVLGAKSSYIVTGYTEDDIEMNILEPGLGTINHHAIVVLLNGLAIIPTHLGLYLCTGNSFHFIAKDYQWLWRFEYGQNQGAYEDEYWAVDDIESNVYKFCTNVHSYNPNGSNETIYWILDYSPMIAEVGGNFAQPNLSFDVRDRKDTGAAVLANPGAKRGILMTGSADGTVRMENIVENHDDDGDGWQKKLIIQTPHYFFGEEGGDPLDAFTYTGFWNFMEAENNAYDLDLFTGDEQAWQHYTPDYHETVPAGKVMQGGFNNRLAAQTVYSCKPMKPGRGITARITVASPRTPSMERPTVNALVVDPILGVTWRGIGCARMPGTNNRQRVTHFTE